jgi:hypothetical protein
MTDVVDTAWAILAQHVGHRNPIKSSTLAEMLEIGDEHRGTRATRAVILEVVRRGLPVAASEEGYFTLENEMELNSYITDLNDRITGIQQRGNLVNRAFQSWKGRQVAAGHPVPPPIKWVPEPEEIA